MSDNGIVARALRARPVVAVTIGTEEFKVRVPMVAAIREFQRLMGEKNHDGAVTALLKECLLGEDGQASVTDPQIQELLGMPWMGRALVSGIMKVSGLEDPAEAKPGGPEKEPDAG